MKKNVKLILLDFGGVISPEGFQLGILSIALLHNRTFEEMYRIMGYEAAYESGYTAGKINEEEYWEIVNEKTGLELDPSIYRNYFLDNFQPRIKMLDIISGLAESNKIKLGIFSDQTNWIYEIDDKYPFLHYFDYKFISCDTGYTKHEDEFYMIPSESTGINSEEILLFDDKERVINKAVESGMNGCVFSTIEKFKDDIGSLELL